jgi:hypothetical protein
MSKLPEVDPAVVDLAIIAIKAAWEAGCPVAHAHEQIAPIAIRRWRTSDRRGVEQNDENARIRDLAIGLVAQLEEDSKLVGPLVRDYKYLASELAKVLPR